ncbi:hypothetical protein DY000_02026714 [Brassica cretica]|uniref:Ubiquitin-like domain-containing protein n=1 Tax=Brassica cretica TaxID=69181 RepID=A0ABQ7E3T7_BRACR|nr:hypothetical protein DY000_02026714 [Brassica cretica]
MAEDGIIQPPEDIATKTIVEKTASFLSRNKMDKSEIMPSDEVDIEPDDHTKDLTIINTPAQVPAITLAARVAYLVSTQGLDLEMQLRDSQVNDTRLPQGMTLKQLDTIKGHSSIFPVFQRAYERLFKPPKDTKEQLYKSAEYTDAIQKGFLQRIQLDDPIKERKWLEQGERAMIDWHDATSKPFAMKEVQELLPPQGPDPKRQKLEVSLLVPETQFLAQHQGLSSLTVSFPNRQAVVIKVSSLSANVASLKQIIAEVIQIPADKHKLSGKSGVLKDDNMTLAHYNVRDGDILTLSL